MKGGKKYNKIYEKIFCIASTKYTGQEPDTFISG